MLATLKDKACNSEQEKEFVDDLYFLKREGNNSTHALAVKKDAITALECLQRSFEIALNYAVYNQKANSNLLKLRYDTELLITGKKSKKSLAEKYELEKAKTRKKPKQIKQSHTTKTPKPICGKNTFFNVILIISGTISVLLILIILLLTKI